MIVIMHIESLFYFIFLIALLTLICRNILPITYSQISIFQAYMPAFPFTLIRADHPLPHQLFSPALRPNVSL